MKRDDELPLLPVAGPDEERRGKSRLRWSGPVLAAVVAVAAFAIGLRAGRATGDGRRGGVVFANPCSSSREVSFFSDPEASESPVFSVTVPAYSTASIPRASRLHPGWSYEVPLPAVRPLGGEFRNQISRGDLATGTLWFPSDLCNG